MPDTHTTTPAEPSQPDYFNSAAIEDAWAGLTVGDVLGATITAPLTAVTFCKAAAAFGDFTQAELNRLRHVADQIDAQLPALSWADAKILQDDLDTLIGELARTRAHQWRMWQGDVLTDMDPDRDEPDHHDPVAVVREQIDQVGPPSCRVTVAEWLLQAVRSWVATQVYRKYFDREQAFRLQPPDTV